jgi:hypothetical protein
MHRGEVFDFDDLPAGHVCCERCGAVVPEAESGVWPVPHGPHEWTTEVVCATCRPRPTRAA